MSQQSSDGTGHYAGSTIHAFVHDEPQGPRFALFYGDATDGYPDSIGIDAGLAEVEAANLNATGGTQTAERSLTISGYPGREQQIQSATASYVFRMVFVGSRLYLFSAKGTEIQVASAMVITYLDSFMVLP